MIERFTNNDFGGCTIDTTGKITFWFENKGGRGNNNETFQSVYCTVHCTFAIGKLIVVIFYRV